MDLLLTTIIVYHINYFRNFLNIPFCYIHYFIKDELLCILFIPFHQNYFRNCLFII